MDYCVDAPNCMQTARCILRCPTLEDIPAIFTNTERFLESLKPWVSWAYQPYSLEIAEEHVRKSIAQFITRESYAYHVFAQERCEHLGFGLLYNIDWDVPKFELGYHVWPAQRGFGYATEIVGELCSMAIRTLGAKRIEIRIDSQNKASIRVAEKAGFHIEGTLVNERRLADGTLRTTHVYSR
jgi:RimJ/RimL family protein N-acetyltransferase